MEGGPHDDARGRALAFFTRAWAYGPPVVTVAILLVQTFVPNAFGWLPPQATSAIIAVAVVALAWHVETTLVAANRALAGLDRRVAALEQTQDAFIKSTSVLTRDKLGAVLALVCRERPRVAHLRIFAISSQQILGFISNQDVTVDRCDLLVRGFGAEDGDMHRDFRSQLKLVVSDWRRLESEGRIEALTVRHYDFHPTEYECIFDRAYLVHGLYDSVPADYSGVQVRDPVLVRGTSDVGRLVVNEFADRFDNLFRTCLDHHGPNTISS